MIPNKVHFRLYERRNTFRKSGKEWALSAQFVGHNPWTIRCWGNKPSNDTVDEVKEMAMRCFEFYYLHLSIPRFDLTRVDI